MFDFHPEPESRSDYTQSRPQSIGGSSIKWDSDSEDPSSWINTPSESSRKSISSPKSLLSVNPKTNMSLFKSPDMSAAIFQTPDSKPYTFQTAPSRPGQTKINKTLEQSTLRRLFERHGISSGLGNRITTLHGQDHDSSLDHPDEPDVNSTYDMHPRWNGFQDENDWCGSGMHVDFKRGDSIQLERLEEIVGHGATATVDLVRCRGIKLARKTVLLRRTLTLRDALQEARALHELRHAHIIRLVGTYTQGRSFSMLLYPVARLNLAEFLDSFRRAQRRDISSDTMPLSQRRWKVNLSSNSVCLLSALRCIHKSGIKHMDIKPQNVLLKWTTPTSDPETWECKMLLCDFGISHIFESNHASQTSSFFGRTPKYAAPEVATDQSHGRAADIFSLGCVFTEMNTVFSGYRLEELDSFRHKGMPAVMDSSGRTSYGPYHRTIRGCQAWIRGLSNMEISTGMIACMLEPDPLMRPRLFTEGENISVDDSDEKAIKVAGPHSHAGTPLSMPTIEVITLTCPHDNDGPEAYVYDTMKDADDDDVSEDTHEIPIQMGVF